MATESPPSRHHHPMLYICRHRKEGSGSGQMHEMCGSTFLGHRKKEDKVNPAAYRVFVAWWFAAGAIDFMISSLVSWRFQKAAKTEA